MIQTMTANVSLTEIYTKLPGKFWGESWEQKLNKYVGSQPTLSSVMSWLHSYQ